MNRREFLGTGIALAGSAALGELHPAPQASTTTIGKHIAPTILQPHAPRALWLSTQGDPGIMLDAPLRRFLFGRIPTTVVLNGELHGYAQLVANTHFFPQPRQLLALGGRQPGLALGAVSARLLDPIPQ